MNSRNTSAESTDWRRLYPFPGAQVNLGHGVSMNYVDVGAGSPVLMVHGNPTWSFYYHPLLLGLTSHRRIAVDHVGCGLSSKPQVYNYCLDQHIENLVALIDHLDLNDVTLVAHDWGGAIGLGAVRLRTERFRKIVLLNTAAFPPPFFPFRIRLCRFPMVGPWAVRKLNAFARAAISMATELPGGLPKAIVDGLLFPYDSYENRVAINRFVADIPTRPEQATWKTLLAIEAFLPTLEIPKMLLWGMKDWCFRPECLERFIGNWPEARVRRFEKAGHYVMLDQAEDVTDEINRFMQDS